jgi:phage shock protein A
VAEDLASATARYRAAQTGIDTAKVEARQVVEQAMTELRQARTALAEAIVAEARRGTRQVDLIKATGLSRERVRQILRAGGIEPDE